MLLILKLNGYHYFFSLNVEQIYQIIFLIQGGQLQALA